MKTTVRKYCDIGLDKNLFSSYANIARAIGISPSALTQYRNETSIPSENTLILLAEAVGEDPLDVLSEYKIENSKHEKVVDFWSGMRNTAAALLLFTVVHQGTITQNIWSEGDVKGTNSAQPFLYIM